MKKLSLLLISGLLLVGCSSNDYSTQVSENNKTLISGENISITKQDYYTYLMDNYGANEVLKVILTTIADKEVTDQKKIDALLKEKKETYAKYYDGSLLEYAQSFGYKDEEEFIENQLLPEVKEELLRNKYIEKNYDQLINEYQVNRFKQIIVDKESTALEIIKTATSTEKFDEQMKKYKDNSEDCGIVTKNTSTIDKNLTKKLQEFQKITKDGVYKDAVKLSNDQYAVIYLYDTNRKNKNDYIKALSTDKDIQNTIESYYLKQYHFEVYDERLKKSIENISKDFFE